MLFFEYHTQIQQRRFLNIDTLSNHQFLGDTLLTNNLITVAATQKMKRHNGRVQRLPLTSETTPIAYFNPLQYGCYAWILCC